jgi:uncharacterized protein YgiM (DUF1202 family)
LLVFPTKRSLALPLVAAAVLLICVSVPSRASGESSNGDIASTALKYLGTHGGQCWTFMQKVVAEATGRRVTGDYRMGYLAAGAVEVSASDATRGDIIQIADVNNQGNLTTPHTAIVLKNLGNGRFDAIDSNQNWDEMVRLRPNYDPYSSATSRNAVVHIYRMPSGGGGATPPAAAHTWTVGESGLVLVDSGCLNLRKSSSLSGAITGCLPVGSAITVTGEPTTADGFTWAKVASAKGDGWMATNYLIPTASGSSDATAQSAPEPVAAVVPSDDGEAAADVAPEPVLARVDDSPGCLNVRKTGALSAKVVACLDAGTQVTILSESGTTAGGHTWVHISTEAGDDGWVASEFLIR